MSSINNVSFSALNHSTSAVNNSIKKISTGSQHPSAAYGASDYAITQRMQYNLGGYHQSISNTQNSNSMLKVASGAVGNTLDSLSSLKQKLLDAANGTNGASDLSTLQKSVDQTISQINENAGVTYNGKKLLDGSNPGITVAGSFGYDNIPLGDITAQGLGLADAEGNSTIDLTDPASIQNALDKVSSALDTVSATKGTLSDSLDAALDEATSLGAFQQGLEFQAANYTTAAENLTSAMSTMDDTDIAAETVNLKSAQTQQQLAMFGIQAQMGMMADRANVAKLLGQ